MGRVAARHLVFRIDDIGFVLDLTRVVEIREQIAGALDLSRTDLERGIVGALTFRQTRIPVIDPAIRLGLSPKTPIKQRVALVLNSPEGNWGLLVDQVGEIGPASKFSSCKMPALLKGTLQKFYSEILLLNDEPMVLFNPDNFYGGVGSQG